jgi:hypothetical protein
MAMPTAARRIPKTHMNFDIANLPTLTPGTAYNLSAQSRL